MQTENQQEHDELINSHSQYKQLMEKFPGWNDKHNLQPYYEKQDLGPMAFLTFK